VVDAAQTVTGSDAWSNANLAYPNAFGGAGNVGLGAQALHGYNGTSWDRVRVANTGRLQVDAVTAAVTGTVSVSNFPATQSVTQGTSPWVVDASGFTVPISAVSLPLPTGAATETTLALMRADLDAMRDSLNEIALTAIVHREVLEEAA
jgi:hypothetical protein